MNRGATLPELLLVMGISAVLITIGGISFGRLQKASQLDELAGGVKIAIYQAQSQSKNNQPTGLYFENNRYFVFHGSQYAADQPGNLTTALPSGISFSQINLAGPALIFDNITGYPEDGVGGNLILTDGASGQSRTISINIFGLVEINQ